MAKQIEDARVISQCELAPGIYEMKIQTETIAAQAVPGQFVSLYTKNPAKLLPRPISLCGIDAEHGILRLVYRVTAPGTGTDEFSGYQPGDTVRVMGPLGNGFPIENGHAVVIGGGIGVPPMLALAKALPGSVTAVMGYRDAHTFLADDFAVVSDLVIATEDGSVGTKGNVLDAVREHGLRADVIYACGPTPMLRAVKAYAAESGVRCFLSLEERMACGIGACLACVCQSKDVDAHSHVHNKRVCKDGPVFPAEEVEL